PARTGSTSTVAERDEAASRSTPFRSPRPLSSGDRRVLTLGERSIRRTVRYACLGAAGCVLDRERDTIKIIKNDGSMRRRWVEMPRIAIVLTSPGCRSHDWGSAL